MTEATHLILTQQGRLCLVICWGFYYLGEMPVAPVSAAIVEKVHQGSNLPIELSAMVAGIP